MDPKTRIQRQQSKIQTAMDKVDAEREKLGEILADLADGGGMSYREIGELAGFTKQYVGDLVNAARARAA